MEVEIDDLIKVTKTENSVSSYLILYKAYISKQKYYPAQLTLERCIEKVTPSTDPLNESTLTTKLLDSTSSLEDYKAVKIVPFSAFYQVYGLLGDTLLLLKKPEEALAYLINSARLYDSSNEFNQSFYLNIVLAGILQSFISLMMKNLYQKDYSLLNEWKTNTEWLISHIKEIPEHRLMADKMKMLLVNFYFILFTWHGRSEDFELCKFYSENLDNLEVKFVLSYYCDKTEALRIARELVMKNPGISLYWTWLGFAEKEYVRKVNAINRALQIDKSNWTAWVALGLFQAGQGDFIRASRTWKIGHHYNHTDSKLWILSSFLYKEGRNLEKAIESFKLACDMDPGLWMTIESYLSVL